MWVVIERDSNGSVLDVFGPFPEMDAAMAWLKGTRVPEWTQKYKSETDLDANIGFFGNGASDGMTATYWLIKNLTEAI